jgi:hypothetical protein
MNQDQIKNPHRIYPGDVIRSTARDPRFRWKAAGRRKAVANVVKLDPRVRSRTPPVGPYHTLPWGRDRPVPHPAAGDRAERAGQRAPIVATSESRVIVGVGDTAYADRIGSSDAVNWQIFRQGKR